MNSGSALYRHARDTASRHAAETSSQLAAARRLRLGGTAGHLPRSYFADAPALTNPQSAFRNPQSR